MIGIINLCLVGGLAIELLDNRSYHTTAGFSMQHGTERESGIIDNGDALYLNELKESDELITYYEGEQRDYDTMGSYGDTLIAHHLVCYIRFNQTDARSSAAIAELGVFGVYEYILSNYGHEG